MSLIIGSNARNYTPKAKSTTPTISKLGQSALSHGLGGALECFEGSTLFSECYKPCLEVVNIFNSTFQVLGLQANIRRLTTSLFHAPQVQSEVQGFLQMLDEVYGTFGLDYSIALSTRPESYLVSRHHICLSDPCAVCGLRVCVHATGISTCGVG